MLDTEALGHNYKKLNFARTVTSIVAGTSCGVLGLSGYRGFLFYALIHVIVSFAILVPMGFRPQKYVYKSNVVSFLYFQIADQGLTFVLFWTLAYALVQIY